MSVLDFVDARELGELAGAVVLAVGMTPAVEVKVPAPAEGCSWADCYQRGLERLSRPVDLS
jgi:hypothetical protein